MSSPSRLPSVGKGQRPGRIIEGLPPRDEGGEDWKEGTVEAGTPATVRRRKGVKSDWDADDSRDNKKEKMTEKDSKKKRPCKPKSRRP